MGSLLIVIALVALLVFRWKLKQAKTVKERKKLIYLALVWGLGITLVVLAATGRIHWLGVVFAAIFPLLKFLGAMLFRFFPVLAQIYQKKNSNSQETENTSQAKPAMDRDEALKLLGLQGNPDADEVRSAHRKLIQKLHPDRGGNDYLASQLNQARDLLLKELSD